MSNLSSSLAQSPWDRIEELVHFQGRSWEWLAERSRMSVAKLRAVRSNKPHNTLHDWQKNLIAEALGVPLDHIWPEEPSDGQEQS